MTDTREKCQACNGTGESVTQWLKDCACCNGTGYVERAESDTDDQGVRSGRERLRS